MVAAGGEGERADLNLGEFLEFGDGLVGASEGAEAYA